MKYLPLIPILFITSCASHRQKHVFLNFPPPPAVEPVEAVRYPDVVRAYHVGRYVDPNHPEEMQEQHPVYRIETQSRWNLHPGPSPFAPAAPAGAQTNAAFSPILTNDAIVAELNRQRQLTQTIMMEGRKLTESLEQLGQAIAETKSVAQEDHELREQLNGVFKRLDALQAEMKKLQGEQAPTNAPPDSSQRR